VLASLCIAAWLLASMFPTFGTGGRLRSLLRLEFAVLVAPALFGAALALGACAWATLTRRKIAAFMSMSITGNNDRETAMNWTRAAAAGAILLAASAGFAGEPDTESQRIWNAEIRDRVNPRVLDHFGVIEMTLFRAVPGISPRSAALASVIERTGGPDPLQRAFPESGAWFETFDEERYVPYFVHDWRPTADAYRAAVGEIVRKGTAAVPAADRR
jgi:hypothetical protein